MDGRTADQTPRHTIGHGPRPRPADTGLRRSREMNRSVLGSCPEGAPVHLGACWLPRRPLAPFAGTALPTLGCDRAATTPADRSTSGMNIVCQQALKCAKNTEGDLM